MQQWYFRNVGQLGYHLCKLPSKYCLSLRNIVSLRQSFRSVKGKLSAASIPQGHALTFLKRAHVRLDYFPIAPHFNQLGFGKIEVEPSYLFIYFFHSPGLVRSSLGVYFWDKWLLLAWKSSFTALGSACLKHQRALFPPQIRFSAWERKEKTLSRHAWKTRHIGVIYYL